MQACPDQSEPAPASDLAARGSPLSLTAVEEAAAVLLRDGCVRCTAMLSPQVCDALWQEIDSRLGTAIATATTHPPNFAQVRTPGHRWDMYLPADCAPVAVALQELLGGALGNLFRVTFDGCVDAPVVELSTLVSDRGADCQPLHQDTTMEVHTYTAFVALQDIDASMGPTLLLPGTHNEIAHRLFDHPATKDDFVSECDVKLATMKQGDAVIMDSRCIHAGGANSSNTRRILFYVTVRHPLCYAYQVRVPASRFHPYPFVAVCPRRIHLCDARKPCFLITRRLKRGWMSTRLAQAQSWQKWSST